MYNMLSVLAASSRTAMCFTLFCACGFVAHCNVFYAVLCLRLCCMLWEHETLSTVLYTRYLSALSLDVDS